MHSELAQRFSAFAHSLYNEGPVPLHAPRFDGNEQRYAAQCLESTFVSYVSPFVKQLEAQVCAYTGIAHAVATSSGTTALHLALRLCNAGPGDLVLCPTLTFVATANAICYTGAEPLFMDCEKTTLGMDPAILENFLTRETTLASDGTLRHRSSQRRIAACVPVHILGFPCQIEAIAEICQRWNLPLVEDAAESLGSTRSGRHCGTWGRLGILSFNGNKIVTTGGGGMLLTNDDGLAEQARHLSTTAKVAHPYLFVHDQLGYNYRMPGINAAIGCGQMERLDAFVADKRATAERYADFFAKQGVFHYREESGSKANYWLNAIRLNNAAERDAFIECAQQNQVQCRPLWNLMHTLPMYQHCLRTSTENALWLQERIVNIPSSVRHAL